MAIAAVLGLMLAGCGPGQSGQSGPQARKDKPNIVLVLVDDMDQELAQYMPHVQQMQRQGVTFSNYTVTDSLCCPSRVSLLSGKFPHDSSVFTNAPPDGGFEKFHRSGGERATIGTQLQQAGYQTGLMGKYLNGYQPARTEGTPGPAMPPGWNEWAVAGNGYGEFDYRLNVNGQVVKHANAPHDYLTDVLARRGNDFIRRNGSESKPFYLEVAPFAPHAPATPAPRHENMFPGITAPRDPSFNEPHKSDKPAWLRNRPPLTGDQIAKMDALYRKRAQSLQAVDEMLGSFQDTLEATGQAQNTDIVFTSDNGYHLGQHGLIQGKQTAFSTDVSVPLIATGPKVPAGRVMNETVENIDLQATFAEIAGAPVAPGNDGESFAGLLAGKVPADRKSVALIEHHGPNRDPRDPDVQTNESGNPPTYTAIRTSRDNYVEYVTGEREYYDRTRDPDELTNTYTQLPPAYQAKLHDTLTRLASCHGSEECVRAAQL